MMSDKNTCVTANAALSADNDLAAAALCPDQRLPTLSYPKQSNAVGYQVIRSDHTPAICAGKESRSKQAQEGAPLNHWRLRRRYDTMHPSRSVRKGELGWHR